MTKLVIRSWNIYVENLTAYIFCDLRKKEINVFRIRTYMKKIIHSTYIPTKDDVVASKAILKY